MLQSKEEIAQACGFPQTPAPGGNCRIPSFVHEAKVQRKGVRFGARTLSWKEIERKLGIPEPPAPGGNCRVPSFVRDNVLNRKGAQFGWKVQPPLPKDVIERMDVVRASARWAGCMGSSVVVCMLCVLACAGPAGGACTQHPEVILVTLIHVPRQSSHFQPHRLASEWRKPQRDEIADASGAECRADTPTGWVGEGRLIS